MLTWKLYPSSSSLMIIAAHPDDEGVFFGGTIPYYAYVRNLPVILIYMTHQKESTRTNELRNAYHEYGLPYEPIFAEFDDCRFGSNLRCC